MILPQAYAKWCDDSQYISYLIIEDDVDLNCAQTKDIDLFAGQVLNLSPIKIKNSVLKLTNDHLKKSLNTGNGVFMKMTEHFHKSLEEQVVFTHELGHVIFDAYFYQHIPPIKKERALSETIKNKVEQLESLHDTDGNCSSEKCKTKAPLIKAELSSLKKERNQLMFQNGSLSSFLQELVRPYNELIADAVVVLFFEDPEILKQTMSIVDPERGEIYVSCRSFTIESGEVYADSDHCALSGLRAYILESILIPGIKSGDKVKALKTLLDLVTRDILNQYEALKKREVELDEEHPSLKNRSYTAELNSLYKPLRGSSDKLTSGNKEYLERSNKEDSNRLQQGDLTHRDQVQPK